MYTPDELVKVAVEHTVAGINNGLSPQEAATKTAQELSLNHNFIKRAAEAVNVALHHAHFKSNPDAKADDFLTVDSQKVAEDIYGVKEKTAATYQSDLFSSFQFPETSPKFSRYLEEGPYKQAFASIVNDNSAITKNATSEKGVYVKGRNYVGKLKKIAFEKEAIAMDAKANIDKSFCAILKKFAEDPDHRSTWDQFETSVFGKHGESSEQYLDLLYKTSQLKEERGKHDASIKLASSCPEASLFDNFIASLGIYKIAQQDSDEAVANLNFEQDYIKEAFTKRGCELNNIGMADKNSLLDRVEASIKAERTKAAAINDEDPVIAFLADKTAKALEEFDGRVKTAGGLIDWATTGAHKAYDDNSKPSLSASSNTPDKNRERALMLQELIATDPVINKFPVHQTVDAYEQMLRIAPELANEREITKAYLRQAGASQAVGPFEAKQLVDANTNLFKQHQLERGMPPSSEKPS